MADKINNLDNLFKSTLANHTATPDPEVWDKLSSRLDNKEKIVSNGYAIQPEKEKLVEGLENKIGDFFIKVDEGFGGLQDAKNNLFASLTTKRDKKKKLTN